MEECPKTMINLVLNTDSCFQNEYENERCNPLSVHLYKFCVHVG